MATLTIELSDEVLAQLQNDAKQQGKAAEVVAQELIAQLLEAKQVSILSAKAISAGQADDTPPLEMTNEEYQAQRQRLRQMLKAAGMLAELHPDLKKMADPNISLEDVHKALGRDGKPLSEIVIEQRGPLY